MTLDAHGLEAPVALRAADLHEHLMRICDDEASLLGFVGTDARSTSARAALGRLVTDTATIPAPGSPVAVFVAGGPLDARWRDGVRDCAGSLWGRLESLVALYGPVDAEPYDALVELSERAELDFG